MYAGPFAIDLAVLKKEETILSSRVPKLALWLALTHRRLWMWYYSTFKARLWETLQFPFVLSWTAAQELLGKEADQMCYMLALKIMVSTLASSMLCLSVSARKAGDKHETPRFHLYQSVPLRNDSFKTGTCSPNTTSFFPNHNTYFETRILPRVWEFYFYPRNPKSPHW